MLWNVKCILSGFAVSSFATSSKVWSVRESKRSNVIWYSFWLSSTFNIAFHVSVTSSSYKMAWQAENTSTRKVFQLLVVSKCFRQLTSNICHWLANKYFQFQRVLKRYWINIGIAKLQLFILFIDILFLKILIQKGS